MRKFLFTSIPTIFKSRISHSTIIERRLKKPKICHKQFSDIIIKKMGCNSSKLKTDGNTVTTTTYTKHGDDMADDYIEQYLCKPDEIGENEMKQFEIDGTDGGKVLLIRQNGRLTAIGTKCSHYNAPLVSGALGDGRVRCQWHGACFNIWTGDIEEFPGLDSLPCHQVTETSDEVRVRAKRTALLDNKRQKAMAQCAPSIADHYVVVGGGPSGATCIETLRQSGFTGKITLICAENCLPYDRVKVSKSMDFDITKAEFRTDSYYTDHAINVMKGVRATSMNINLKTIELSTGETINYTKCYLATGLRARKLPINGHTLRNVVALRDYADAAYTHSQLALDKHVIVLGASFVALEAANYCLGKVANVTVIMRGELPFQPFLGPRIGQAFKRLFVDKGVEIRTNSGLKRCIPHDHTDLVAGVELIDGSTLPADLVIMGVGSDLNTEFLKDSGLELRTDGAVEVDEYMQTGCDGVYAGGDIAHAPVWSWSNRKATIGHYPLAQLHGHVAGLNMAGKQKALEAVPYFWTMLFGKGVRYAGHGPYVDIVYVGDVDALKFVAFYIDGDDVVVAASSCGMDPIVSQFAEVMAQGKHLKRADVVGVDPLGWRAWLHEKK